MSTTVQPIIWQCDISKMVCANYQRE